MPTKLQSPDDLKEYCFRALGKPVINIEVAPVQADDRVADALQYFIDNHYAGSEEQIIRKVFTATDELRQTIKLPSNMIAVLEIYDPAIDADGQSSGDDFDRLNYLIAQSDYFSFSGSQGREYDLLSYDMTMQYISLMQMYFQKRRSFGFNKVTSELRIQSGRIKEGNFIMIRGWMGIDPDRAVDIYNESWVKKYAKALMKRQWGENLKKYDGVQMVGGVTLNGKQIFDEAVEELNSLEESFMNKYTLPYGPIWG